MRRIVIVGGGLGGFRTARSLRAAGFDGDVIVVGDEESLPYDRPPLSKQLLAGTFTPEQCLLAGETSDVRWLLGTAVAGVSLGRQVLTLTDGTDLGFDDLVVATGRRARPWPGPPTVARVHTLRSLADVAAFQADLADAVDVVVIGAGFVGCEAAATLRQRGLAVTVVDVSAHPMPVLGDVAGEVARKRHAEHGVRWRLGTTVAAIEGQARVRGVRLADGELLPADAVLVAIGSLPNTEWLAGAGVALRGGAVEVDRTGRALDEAGAPVPGLWAVGDAAAWAHPHAPGPVCVEHWSNARDMADVVATNLVAAADERTVLTSVPSFWSDQYDMKIKSVGYLRAADQLALVEEDPARRALLVEARRAGEVVGVIAFNMPKAVLGYQRALRLRSA
ncbi:NAD(P)/FAD-dependent oxidoreductase [Parafrankia sp. FMc2]|uniref:NAD(P)/FAD-dependent oxidoreductase n=1 Tax=Parafrankia sp. FMc2 TaxID=3233196 RepID=UPI0034D4E4BC